MNSSLAIADTGFSTTVRNSTGNHKKLYGKSKFLHKEHFFTLAGYGVLLVTECGKVGYKPEFVINSIVVIDDGELSVVLLIVFRTI